jgi:hypothetical protein
MAIFFNNALPKSVILVEFDAIGGRYVDLSDAKFMRELELLIFAMPNLKGTDFVEALSL